MKHIVKVAVAHAVVFERTSPLTIITQLNCRFDTSLLVCFRMPLGWFYHTAYAPVYNSYYNALDQSDRRPVGEQIAG